MFTIYVAPIGLLINSYGINHHKYAGNTQPYTASSNHPETTSNGSSLAPPAFNIGSGRTTFVLNPDKSKVCFFGTGQKLSRTPLPLTVTVAGFPIMVQDKIKTLGLTLDAILTFEEYVNNVAKACNFHMWVCATSAAQYLVMLLIPWRPILVGTRLDYCNALLYGTTEKSLKKLQIVQNKLARVVCNVIIRQ